MLWHCYVENAALPHFALHPYSATMSVHEGLCQRKPKTQAFDSSRLHLLGAIEGSEQPSLDFFGDAQTVVADADDDLVYILFEFYNDFAALG